MSDAEGAVATLIGETYTGAASACPDGEVTREPTTTDGDALPTYGSEDYDADFQTQMALYVCRDVQFMRRAAHLVRPEYFENVGQASIVNLALRFWQKYNTLPDRVAAMQQLKDDIAAKVVRGDAKNEAVEAFRALYGPVNPDLSRTDYYTEHAATFARKQAITQALLASVGELGKKNFAKIETLMGAAMRVALNSSDEEYNYWTKIDDRTAVRKDKLAGVRPPTGITTGILELDALMYHKGWGRGELSALMGGPKSGKTTGLINFGIAASLAGFNVFYATCEVNKEIISMRADARVAEMLVKELDTKIHDAEAKVKALAARAGAFEVREFPSGTLTPKLLEATLEEYKQAKRQSDGTIRQPIRFDLIIVDYADIMDDDVPREDEKARSKWIWIKLRALASKENAAMLTATAINREGIKATTAGMTHVADDINKVRTVDLMISINISDEDRANHEARLNFTASRNQETGFTLYVKQDIARMRFIQKILKVE